MLDSLKAMIRDDEGATLVEYSLVVALIACVCIGAITALGNNIVGLFNTIGGKINGANTTAGG